MERAQIGDVELEFESIGAGEPIIFIHGAFVSDVFWPLGTEPALANRFQLILYRRRGYAGSGRTGELTIEQHARDCLALLKHLNVESAHVVGHSYGGCVALQVALTAPGAVRTLALLEPGLAVGETASGYRDALASGVARYQEVGASVVVDEFLQARWPGYRDVLEDLLPGALDQAVGDASTWFDHEVGGQLEWLEKDLDWSRIAHPALSVLGGASNALWPRFGETHRFLMSRLADCEGFVLPDATHFLHVESPVLRTRFAEVLADFIARNAAESSQA